MGDCCSFCTLDSVTVHRLLMMCRAAEAEKERLSVELEQVWAELSRVMRAVYHLDSSADVDTFDSDRLSRLVSRQVPTQPVLCFHLSGLVSRHVPTHPVLCFHLSGLVIMQVPTHPVLCFHCH